MVVIRIVLPVLIALAGVVLLVAGGDAAKGAGVLLLGVALLVVLANLFVRLSLQSERDREQEEHYRALGRWPDDF